MYSSAHSSHDIDRSTTNISRQQGFPLSHTQFTTALPPVPSTLLKFGVSAQDFQSVFPHTCGALPHVSEEKPTPPPLFSCMNDFSCSFVRSFCPAPPPSPPQPTTVPLGTEYQFGTLEFGCGALFHSLKNDQISLTADHPMSMEFGVSVAE